MKEWLGRGRRKPSARRAIPGKGGSIVRMRQAWSRFWFEPAPATNLAACRVLFFGALFLFYLPCDFSAWGRVSPVFWFPVSLFRHLRLPLLPASGLAVLHTVWKLSLALSCLGLFTRAGTATAFVLGVYLLGIAHNFGSTSHGDALVVWVLAILALSRCGDAGSLDAMIRRARPAAHAPGPPPYSGEYTWPVRMVWLAMALIFFAAGFAKLRYSGLAWATSNNLPIILTQGRYHLSNGEPLTPWGPLLAHYRWLCHVLAAGTIVTEIAFPLALFSRRCRAVLVPAEFLLQLGVRLFMGPSFEQFMISYVFWIPWDRAGARLAKSLGMRGRSAREKEAPLSPSPVAHRPGQAGAEQSPQLEWKRRAFRLRDR